MPTYTYTALRSDGTRYTGTSAAADKFELYAIVAREDGTILSFNEEGEKKTLSIQGLFSLFGRVKEAEKIILMRNLGAMLHAGLALSRALAVMIRQTKNETLKQILTAIDGDIQKGSSLHEAIQKHPKAFPPLVTAMIRAGEESGQLSNTFDTIAGQLDRAHTLKRKIRGALIYPGIIVTTLFGIGVLMLIFVVPTLRSTFEELNIDLPTSTRAIIGLSNFLVEHTFFAVLIMIVVVGVSTTVLRTAWGRRIFQAAMLRVPIINGLIREINAARTTRTLSSLLSSGVPIVSALSIARDVLQNVHFKEVIARAETEVQKGEPLATSFMQAEHLYPPLVGEFIAVGEETGRLSAMLLEVADFYERDVEQKTKDMSTIIEPFLMLIVGAGVGFFAISMITPIYSITQGI